MVGCRRCHGPPWERAHAVGQVGWKQKIIVRLVPTEFSAYGSFTGNHLSFDRFSLRVILERTLKSDKSARFATVQKSEPMVGS